MDNLSEYIPLLIIIASVIISFLRKGRHAKKVDLPEDVFELEEPQPYFVPEEPVADKKPATPVSQKITATPKKAPARYKKNVEMPEVDEYESIDIDLSDPEEVKRAIIYSEIFK